MSTTHVDLSTVKINARGFLRPFIAIHCDTVKGTPMYTFHAVNRNGAINVVRYVPRDVYPQLDKPEKVNEQLEVAFADNNAVQVNIRTVECGDAVIEAIGPNITDKNMLTIRDKSGFIKLTPLMSKPTYFRHYSAAYEESYDIWTYDVKTDDYIVSSIISAFMTMINEQTRVNHYGRSYRNGVMINGQLVAIMDFISVMGKAFERCQIPGKVMEDTISSILRAICDTGTGEYDF